MSSKDVKPKIRIGRKARSLPQKIALWVAGLALCGGVGYATYYYGVRTVVEVAVARVRRGNFVRAVRVRGEAKSVNSYLLIAPQVPNLRITRLAVSGRPVSKGDVVVEFDGAANEMALTQMNLQVQTVKSQQVSMNASQKMTNEADKMNLMTSAYSLERAKLEASKAEVVSNIEKEKSIIEVGTAEGSLDLTRASVNAHLVSQQTDRQRLQVNMDKTNRDMERVKGYVSNMVLRAPVDGVVNILSNFRSGGDFGSAGIPFREGDSVWTRMAIAEIPDLSKMRVEVRLDEVDRGNVKLGQPVKVRVDAIPDREFDATLDWISPIATLQFRGSRDADKQFPAYATLATVDPRLRPGMSVSIDIIIDSQPNVLLIPIRASFTQNGKPSVYIENGQQFKVRQIEVGARNDAELVVTGGLKDGELVTLEDPKEAAKRSKKKL
jgi:multidrug efflux pump subunit AcrA (membrane-fusion protein)